MSARDARIAVYDKIAADTKTATVVSGAGNTTATIQLTTGGAASWTAGEVVNVTGTGSTAANDGLVTTVTASSSVTDRLTVSPALAIAPQAGDVVGAGWRQWARTPGSGELWAYLGPMYAEHPAIATLRATPANHVVGIIVLLADDPIAGDLHSVDIRVRVIGLNVEWVEGASLRLRSILHARPSGLTLASGVCPTLLGGQTTFPIRDDDLVEHVLPFRLTTAPVL